MSELDSKLLLLKQLGWSDALLASVAESEKIPLVEDFEGDSFSDEFEFPDVENLTIEIQPIYSSKLVLTS